MTATYTETTHDLGSPSAVAGRKKSMKEVLAQNACSVPTVLPRQLLLATV